MSVAAPPCEQVDPFYMDDDAPETPEYFARVAAWLTRLGMTRPRPR